MTKAIFQRSVADHTPRVFRPSPQRLRLAEACPVAVSRRVPVLIPTRDKPAVLGAIPSVVVLPIDAHSFAVSVAQGPIPERLVGHPLGANGDSASAVVAETDVLEVPAASEHSGPEHVELLAGVSVRPGRWLIPQKASTGSPVTSCEGLVPDEFLRAAVAAAKRVEVLVRVRRVRAQHSPATEPCSRAQVDFGFLPGACGRSLSIAHDGLIHQAWPPGQR